MQNFKLGDHKFKKGKFISPWNEMLTPLTEDESWTYGRLPEYFWIALIFNFFGREIGLEKCYFAIKRLNEIEPEMQLPLMSNILRMDSKKKSDFFDYLVTLGLLEALAPLTVILTHNVSEEFSKTFFSGLGVEKRFIEISKTLRKGNNHQSYFSTDVRFVVLYFKMLSGKFHVTKEIGESYLKYPKLDHNAEEMKMIRPSIRSSEVIFLKMDDSKLVFAEMFWERVSEMQTCELFLVQFVEEEQDYQGYVEKIKPIFEYFAKLLQTTSPLDDKMLVLIGVATYSYKRFLEMVNHNLFNAISGRSITRVLVEDYIMMKYLLKQEIEYENIWKEFQMYGIGQYKLILQKSREFSEVRDQSHVNYLYLESLVNEYTNENFIDMDTNYFGKGGVRDKALLVGERELFGLYYDYDSAFEHGLWGAIRESSMLKCNVPSHQYHCVPDVNDEQKLKSVWHDGVMMINKTILLLNEIYGVPNDLLEGIDLKK
ncbi:MAG: hypothetical protein K0R18_850 [Bacillales bacterium]|nr:hypothetical protein [Bacillales bacterium]